MKIEETRAVLVRSRRAAREAAFQAIYQVDVGKSNPGEAVEDALERDPNPFAPSAAAYIRATVNGVADNLEAIDALIAPLLDRKWQMDRLAATDRCVLRLACYELFYEPDIPPKVTINEAVLIAKRFGSEEGAKFVNGLLGRLLQQSPKAVWEPGSHATFEDSELEPAAEEAEEEEVVAEGSQEYEELRSVGPWTLKTPEAPSNEGEREL